MWVSYHLDIMTRGGATLQTSHLTTSPAFYNNISSSGVYEHIDLWDPLQGILLLSLSDGLSVTWVQMTLAGARDSVTFVQSLEFSLTTIPWSRALYCHESTFLPTWWTDMYFFLIIYLKPFQTFRESREPSPGYVPGVGRQEAGKQLVCIRATHHHPGLSKAGPPRTSAISQGSCWSSGSLSTLHTYTNIFSPPFHHTS